MVASLRWYDANATDSARPGIPVVCGAVTVWSTVAIPLTSNVRRPRPAPVVAFKIHAHR